MSRSTAAAAAISILLHALFFWVRPPAPEKMAAPPTETAIRIRIASAASPPPRKPPEQPPKQAEERPPPPKKRPKPLPPPPEPQKEPLPKPVPVEKVEVAPPPEAPVVEEEPIVEEEPVEEAIPEAVHEREVESVPDLPVVAEATEVVPGPAEPLNLTPSPGMPDDGLDPFRVAVLRQLQRHQLYPKRARDRGIEGTVYVQFTIDGEGRVHEVEILPPDEAHPLLVQAAMETIRKASPLPTVPEPLKKEKKIVIVLGMRFELR